MRACILSGLAVRGALLLPVRDRWLPDSGGWRYLLSDPETLRIAPYGRIHASNMSVLTGIDDHQIRMIYRVCRRPIQRLAIRRLTADSTM